MATVLGLGRDYVAALAIPDPRRDCLVYITVGQQSLIVPIQSQYLSGQLDLSVFFCYAPAHGHARRTELLYEFSATIYIYVFRGLTHREPIKEIIIAIGFPDHEIVPGIDDIILEHSLQPID